VSNFAELSSLLIENEEATFHAFELVKLQGVELQRLEETVRDSVRFDGPIVPQFPPTV
jgi:hypothetical protein